MTDYEMDKQTCVTWLTNADGDFTANLVELEGYFQSVPDDVCDAFERLNQHGRIEVIHQASKNVVYAADNKSLIHVSMAGSDIKKIFAKTEGTLRHGESKHVLYSTRNMLTELFVQLPSALQQEIKSAYPLMTKATGL